jgi:hypothetical protein
MFSKITASFTVGLALVAATVALPTASCVATNGPSEETCESRCCANMACCETSAERTAPPAQPLAKSGHQQNVSVMPAIAAVTLVSFATESHVFSSTESRPHAPPPLALICIRLI